jgi:hypothetical protein
MNLQELLDKIDEGLERAKAEGITASDISVQVPGYQGENEDGELVSSDPNLLSFVTDVPAGLDENGDIVEEEGPVLMILPNDHPLCNGGAPEEWGLEPDLGDEY